MAVQDRVSIVIPAYNSAAFIAEAIDSCLAQTYSDTELIVIDDGSTDNTLEIVQSYGDKLRLIQQVNSGPAIARNTGITAATGSFIQFCDSDDLLHPEKIERCMSLMQDNPELALVYSKLRQVAVDGQSSAGLPDFPPDDYFETRHLFCKILRHGGSPLQTSSLLLRKSSLEAVGMYRADPDHRCAEDWDLLLRLADSYEMAGVPEILTFYRHHADTLTTNKLLMAEGRLQTVQYARDYSSRKSCINDGEYDRFEAGRHHTLAMNLWRMNRRSEARSHLSKAIHLTDDSRVSRRITALLTFLIPFDLFDSVIQLRRKSA